MKIHIALVSDQVLANLIPALMDHPDLVVLACSRDMAGKGLDKRLAQLLVPASIRVEIEPEAPDVGLSQIQSFAERLAQRIRAAHPRAEVVLNATGGTKLMSLGFVEVFRSHADRILYTDTAHGRIEYLPVGRGTVPHPVPMSNVLDVPAYLEAQGFVFQAAVSDDRAWREAAARRRNLAGYLARNMVQFQRFIGVLNALAGNALERDPGTWTERLANPRQRLREVPFGPMDRILTELSTFGLIDWDPGDRDLYFRTTEAARFVRGGWLEEHAWDVLHTAGLHDTRLGVTGHWEGAPRSLNELDVLGCHLNQLLFIECKTLSFQEGNDNEIAYKLDSLSTDARGLFGATWLLSAREPSQVLSERARQARIRIIGPQDLPRLAQAVTEWMRGPPRPVR